MELNRRNFLKGAAVIGAGAAAASLSGFTGESKSGSSSTASNAAVSSAVSASGESGNGYTWDEEYDIVIVGAGGAGLIAALEAAQADPEAKIHVIEKMDIIGGSSAMSGGNIGSIGTDVQEAAAADDDFFADDTTDMYFEDKMAAGDYQSDPDLVRIFVDNSHDNYEWLKSLGVTWSKMGVYESPAYLPSNPSHAQVQGASVYLQDYDEDGCYKGINRKGRWVCGPSYGDYTKGNCIIQCLNDQLASCPNVDIVTSTRLKKIIRDGVYEGDVLGITVTEGDSTDEQYIKADRAVVLACGGFCSNPEMIHMYNGKVDLSCPATGGKGNTGDGLIAAEYIGAQTVNMQSIQIDLGGCTAQVGLFTTKATSPFAGPGTFINVDATGSRFWAEMAGCTQYYEAKLTLLAKKGFHTWWTLGDANSMAAGGGTDEDIASFLDGVGFKADSIDDLATIIGCDAATLQTTLDTYNGYVDSGVDEEFGKSAFYLTQRIDTPPYYIYETGYSCRSTPGGLRINTDTQVLDLMGDPIPHLFAAGEVTGNLHGRFRNNGGDSWTDITCFGRIAGDNAVKA